MPPSERIDQPPVSCRRCAAELRPGAGDYYLVKILAVADPSPPTLLEEDPSAEIRRLIRQMDGMTEREATDQVYRRLLFFLCAPCYRRWIEDPTSG